MLWRTVRQSVCSPLSLQYNGMRDERVQLATNRVDDKCSRVAAWPAGSVFIARFPSEVLIK